MADDNRHWEFGRGWVEGAPAPEMPSQDNPQLVTWNNNVPSYSLGNNANLAGLNFLSSNMPTSTSGFGGMAASNSALVSNAEGAAPYTATYGTSNGGTLTYDPVTASFTGYHPATPSSTANQQLFKSTNPKFLGWDMFRTDPGNYTLPDGTVVNQTSTFGQAPGNYYLVDPKTGQISEATSHEAAPYDTGPGGFADWSNNNGWMIPLAMAGVGAGLSAAGAGAAETGAGVGAAETGGTAGGTGLTGGAGGSTGLLSGGTTSGLTIPSGAAIAVDPAITAGAGAGIGGGTATGLNGVGGLSAALPAQGSVGGAGAGLSAQLAPNTVIGTGLNGGAIGGTYLAGPNGMVATDMFGNAIPASSVGLNGTTSTGSAMADALKTANKTRQVASGVNSLSKLLNGGGSNLTSALGNLATGQTGAGMAIPGIIRGNQNPFVQTQNLPIQNAKPLDLASLAELLRQG